MSRSRCRRSATGTRPNARRGPVARTVFSRVADSLPETQHMKPVLLTVSMTFNFLFNALPATRRNSQEGNAAATVAQRPVFVSVAAMPVGREQRPPRLGLGLQRSPSSSQDEGRPPACALTKRQMRIRGAVPIAAAFLPTDCYRRMDPRVGALASGQIHRSQDLRIQNSDGRR